MSWSICQNDVQGCRMASSEGVLDPNSRHVRNFVVMQPMHLNRTSRSLLTTQDRTSGADFSGSCLPRLVKLYPETINRSIWAAAKAASQWDRQIWDHTRRFFQLCAASIDQPEFLSDAMDASSSWQSGQFSDIVGNQDPRYPVQCYLKATEQTLICFPADLLHKHYLQTSHPIKCWHDAVRDAPESASAISCPDHADLRLQSLPFINLKPFASCNPHVDEHVRVFFVVVENPGDLICLYVNAQST